MWLPTVQASAVVVIIWYTAVGYLASTLRKVAPTFKVVVLVRYPVVVNQNEPVVLLRDIGKHNRPRCDAASGAVLIAYMNFIEK